MPYTISQSENPISRFSKAFVNRLLYRPDIVLKDSLYAAGVVYVSSSISFNNNVNAAVSQGLTFATIKNLEYALSVAMA